MCSPDYKLWNHKSCLWKEVPRCKAQRRSLQKCRNRTHISWWSSPKLLDIKSDLNLIIHPHYLISHRKRAQALLDHLLIFIELRGVAFDLQKNNFSQLPTRKPIKYDIINPLPNKHQILHMIRELWQKRDNFFCHFSQNRTSRMTNRLLLDCRKFTMKNKICQRICQNSSDSNSYNELRKIFHTQTKK